MRSSVESRNAPKREAWPRRRAGNRLEERDRRGETEEQPEHGNVVGTDADPGEQRHERVEHGVGRASDALL